MGELMVKRFLVLSIVALAVLLCIEAAAQNTTTGAAAGKQTTINSKQAPPSILQPSLGLPDVAQPADAKTGNATGGKSVVEASGAGSADDAANITTGTPVRSSTIHRRRHTISSIIQKPEIAPVIQKPVEQKPIMQSPLPEILSDGRVDKVALLAKHEQQGAVAKKEPGIAKTAILTFIKLIAVLALAYLSIRLLKWVSSGRSTFSSVRQVLKVVDTARLSSTNSLHVVRVDGKALLIGCSSGQLNLLAELDGEEEVAAEEAQQDGLFANYLAKYSAGSSNNNTAGRVAGLLRDCTAHLKDRQRKLKTDMQATGGGDET